MTADHLVGIWVRYGIVILATGILSAFTLPAAWQVPIAVLTLVYFAVVVHTWPAASYARRAPRPWAGWVTLVAVTAHAFGGAAAAIAHEPLALRFARPEGFGGGMDLQNLMYNYRTFREVGTAIMVYALVSAAWALAAGFAARLAYGAVPAGEPVIRLTRRRASPGRR